MKLKSTDKLLIQIFGGFALIWAIATIIGGLSVLLFAFIFFIIVGSVVLLGLEEMGYFDKDSDDGGGSVI